MVLHSFSKAARTPRHKEGSLRPQKSISHRLEAGGLRQGAGRAPPHPSGGPFLPCWRLVAPGAPRLEAAGLRAWLCLHMTISPPHLRLHVAASFLRVSFPPEDPVLACQGAPH